MIAVTSHRAHNKSDEYARNQRYARESWKGIFKEVIYLSNHEPELAGPDTFFLGYDGWPTLRHMADVASRQSDIAVIINADIVLTPSILNAVSVMQQIGIVAMTSYRKEFDTADYPDLSSAKIVDKGLDIWVAQPSIWYRIAQDAPEFLRMGHIQIDTWLCGWLCKHTGYAFRNFNDYGCVYHPKHGGRNQPHNPSEPLKDECSIVAKLPGPL